MTVAATNETKVGHAVLADWTHS